MVDFFTNGFVALYINARRKSANEQIHQNQENIIFRLNGIDLKTDVRIFTFFAFKNFKKM